ncbi:MAG: class I SAM-dependent methyltransferase [Helicobacteraceae bacterium]|jgi:SAM-dependent methyltransferase|nr:class I SAM-dependent methyltransferase [Helicobacteraceae bacterium]
MSFERARFELFNLARIAFRSAQYLFKKINPNYFPIGGGLNTGGGGTNRAEYCKNVWGTHIGAFNMFAAPKIPRRIAEFGPGNSIGTGLCALLCGADEYYAFDAFYYGNIAENITVLEELIKLYDNENFDQIKRREREREERADRLEKIKMVLNGEKGETIKIDYIATWENYAAPLPKVDFVFSQAVLEHIDNLENFYETQARILDRGGFCSHQIDFRSHGETFEWNGHYAISEKKWRRIRYVRPYSINREPLSTHVNLLKKSGFEIVYLRKTEGGKNAIKRDRLALKFRNLSDEDFMTSSALIVAKKL